MYYNNEELKFHISIIHKHCVFFFQLLLPLYCVGIPDLSYLNHDDENHASGLENLLLSVNECVNVCEHGAA